MKNNEKQVMFIVDKDLEQKFKIFCINSKTTKSEELRNFMKQCVSTID